MTPSVRFGSILLCLLLSGAVLDSAEALDLSLPPSGDAPGAYSTSSRTYGFPTGSEERHFSYRIPADLVQRDAGTVPVVLLLHGGLPSGAGDERFMEEFLDGIDETQRPFGDFAYISVRAAEIKVARCLELFDAARLDEEGRNACLANAAANRHAWRFAGASAATRPDPDLPEAYTIFEPEAYVDVIALEAILRDFSDTFASLDLGRVFIATFSYGSHVADQVLCSRSSMVRGVASITGSWLTRRQFGDDGAIGGLDGALECGSGHEPGFFTLTGLASDPYGRRSPEGFPSETGELHNRIPIFRAIGLADHNLTEGLTATVAAAAMAQLNGVENRVSSLKTLKDIDRSTDDGKAMTIAKYRRPAEGERRRTRASLEIGQCGLSSGRGQPAFDPHVVPGVDGVGCAHGIWGNDDNVGNDQDWPTLAVRFFSRL